MYAELSKWVTLVLAVSVIIILVKAGMKILNILVMILLLGFVWVSFFTETGAARLSIALSGHPIIAYTTTLEKVDDISNNEVSYFRSSKDVIVDGKKLDYVKCYTKWIVRIPSVGDDNWRNIPSLDELNDLNGL